MTEHKTQRRQGEPPDAGRRWRRLHILAAVLGPVLLTALGLGAAWQFRLSVAEALVVRALEGGGFAPARLRVERVDFRGLRIADIRLGEGAAVRVAGVAADYTLDGLLAGRMDRLVVTAPVLSARLDDSGLSLAGVSVPAGAGAGGLPSLPIRQLRIDGLRLALGTPAGAFALRADASLMPTAAGTVDLSLAADIATPAGPVSLAYDGAATGAADGASSMEGTLTLRADEAPLTGEANARVEVQRDTADGIEGRLTLLDAAFDQGQFGLAGASGEITFATGAAGIEGLRADIGYRAARAAGIDFLPGRLTLDLADGELRAAAVLDTAEGRIEATATAGTLAANPVAATVKGEIAARLLGLLLPAFRDVGGQIGLDLAATAPRADRLRGLSPDALEAWPGAVSVEGTARLDLARLPVPGIAGGLALRGPVRLALATDGLRMSAPDGLALSAGGVAPGLLKSLPAALAHMLAGPLTATLPADKAAPMVHLVFADDGYALRTTGNLALTGGELAVDGAFDAGLALDAALTPLRLTVPRLRLSLGPTTIGGTRLAAAELRLDDLGGRPDALAGRLRLSATVTDAGGDDFRAARATLDLDATARLADGNLHLVPAADSRLVIDGLTLAGLALAGPLTLSPAAGGPAVATLPLGPGEAVFDLALAPMEAVLRLPDKDGTTRAVRIGLPVTRLSGDGAGLRLRIDGGRLAAPALGLAVAGLSLEARSGDDGTAEATLSASNVRYGAPRPLVVPLHLDARLRRNGAAVTATARLSDAGDRLVVTAKAEHSLDTGRGTAKIESKRLTFLPTVLQPRDLFPRFGRRLREVDGALDLLAELSWDGDRVRSSVELLVEANKLVADELSLEGASTVLRLDTLDPPSTPPAQEARIGLIDIGVPLTDGELIYRLRPDGAIELRMRDFNLFGGRIESDTLVLPPGGGDATVLLRVTGMQLQKLLELARFGELTATGTLDGTIPVALEDGELAIHGAVLESTAGGTLRYLPKAVGPALGAVDASAELFLRAVKDFRYDHIRVTLDEGDAEELVLRFEIKGRNPALYDGFPVELNVNITGPLGRLVRDAVAAYRLPERIGRQFRRFGD